MRLHERITPRATRRPASELPCWQELVAEADVCARHADEAAQCGRFCDACGLILTADALCRRALGIGTRCDEQITIEAEVLSRLGFYQNEVERLVDRSVKTRLEQF